MKILVIGGKTFHLYEVSFAGVCEQVTMFAASRVRIKSCEYWEKYQHEIPDDLSRLYFVEEPTVEYEEALSWIGRIKRLAVAVLYRSQEHKWLLLNEGLYSRAYGWTSGSNPEPVGYVVRSASVEEDPRADRGPIFC